MRRFGEIGRVKTPEVEYIIFSVRHEYGQLDIPWFDIRISYKSSKRLNISQYSLLRKTFDVKTIQSIENIIKKYLDETKPEYLAISAYEEDFAKRIAFYTKRLNKMNYHMIEMKWSIYIFKRD